MPVRGDAGRLREVEEGEARGGHDRERDPRHVDGAGDAAPSGTHASHAAPRQGAGPRPAAPAEDPDARRRARSDDRHGCLGRAGAVGHADARARSATRSRAPPRSRWRRRGPTASRTPRWPRGCAVRAAPAGGAVNAPPARLVACVTSTHRSDPPQALATASFSATRSLALRARRFRRTSVAVGVMTPS